MAKYQKYAEYKDSGVEWLGEIPKHWINTRFKFCCDRVVVGIAEAATHAYADEGVPILRSTNIRETGLDTKNLIYIKQIFADQNDSKYLYANDIITVRTGYPGISSVVPIELDKSQCFTNLISTPNKKFNPNFLTFFLNSDIGKRYFELLGWGSAQKNISVPILQNFFLATPDILEQHLIVDFLDHETAQIDSLIAKQEKLIELLKEKRQAVISHAVTKGLNPDVSMKDSGVEWLGQVPEHWITSKLKYFAVIQGGFAFSSDLFIEEGIQVLRIGNVYQNSLSLDRQPIFIANDLVKKYEDFIVKKDDVLISLTGTLGKRDYGFAIKVETNDQYLLNQRVAKISPNKNIDTDFMVYVLWSESYLTQLYSLPSGTKQANLSNSDVLGIEIVVPPTMQEQKQIARYIKEKLEKFDEMISKAESAIQLMQERRTALISSAVTGKIDVRNWQDPNEAKTELSL